MKSLWTALALVALQPVSPLAWQKTAKAGGAVNGAGARPLSPATIAKSIFLGQIYPSGNVYLKGFTKDPSSPERPLWPRRVAIYGLGRKDPSLPEPLVGRFDRALKDITERSDRPGVSVSYSTYVPGIEGMDDRHRPCGKDERYTTNASYEYQEKQPGGEFFVSTDDHCESNEGIALYKTQYISLRSSRVISIGSDLATETPLVIEADMRRPLTEAERGDVGRQKREARAAADCTTVPRFLDEALQLVVVQIRDSKYRARVSRYTSPGCYGHLGTTYIMDVMVEERPVRKYELLQYHGNL